MTSLQEKAIKVITKHIDADNIKISRKYFDLNIMNVNDQIYYQLSTLMWDYDHDVLPSSLTQCFTWSNRIHTYKTCGASRGNVYHTKY